jgi:hypothetical protein
MTTDNHASMRRELLTLLSRRVTEASSRVKTALALVNHGHDKRAFDILLEADQPMHETRTLLSMISLLMREEK